MPKPTSSELIELRRIAYRCDMIDIIRALEFNKIPVDLLNLNAAALAARTTRTHVRRLIRRHRIPTFRVGNRLLVSLGAVIRPEKDRYQ